MVFLILLAQTSFFLTFNRLTNTHFLAAIFIDCILRIYISLFFNEASNLNSRFFDYNYLMLVWRVQFFSLLEFHLFKS
ncbi:hypothetical protein F0363_01965 [Orientia tsutsugamushi]|nr:hypothetical protein F0363_01965 [Orientia tsutsugamushi]